ncbi:MAG TPA: MarR family transcriptional regulator [Candidatus Nanopelagicales bacterium]|jgi:DNA-binding MarR family transcriptional regulator|nr:MarR family transcriptional regulator [Candidatus Nanopelagicales bacterium]
MSHASELDRVGNLLGALSVAVAERLYSAVTTATGRPRSDTAALVILATVLNGASQDSLAAVLSLSQSGATRLVDRLVDGGLLTRKAGPDGRTHAITLTRAGRRAAEQALGERAGVTGELTSSLDLGQRRALAEALEVMLGSITADRADALHICRLCDPVACGHFTGNCPVTEAVIVKSGRA